MHTGIVAIVPAAGIGKRFHVSKRKTFVDLQGVPLLIHTLKRLHSESSVSEIIPVLRKEDIDMGLEMCREYKLEKVKIIAPGGQERQDSIYNALQLIEKSGPASKIADVLVLIHDGARPVIPAGMIESLLANINGVDGVIPALPVKDTIKEVDRNGIVITTLNRENVRAVQTPQMFPFRVVKEAYDRAYAEGFYATDDAALVERIGGRVRVIAGSYFNIKITTPDDLDMVEYILKREQT